MKSLHHYSEALVNLLAYEELSEIVKSDLNIEYVKLSNLQNIVDTKGIVQSIDDESRSVLEIEDNAKLIFSALTCYVNDLKKSISEIGELYGDKTIPLQFTRKDIEIAQDVSKEISKT